MRDNHQHVEQAKSYGGNHKEIHRGGDTRMILEEGPPTLCRSASALGAVFPDRDRRGLQPQFNQFVTDARTAPSRVDAPSPPHQLNQRGLLSGSPTARPRLPAPEPLEPGSLPTENGLGLEEAQRGTPVWSPSFQDHPRLPVFALQSGLVRRSIEHRDLAPEGEVLQGELVLGTEPGKKVAQERRDNREHG